MMGVAINLAVNTSGLLFLIFMMVIYFSKKNMNNMDNTLFKLLLIFNFLNSFIHIFYLLYQWYGMKFEPLLVASIRGYWIPIQCYIVVIAFYIFITLKNDDANFMKSLNDNKKKFFTILGLSLLFVTSLMAFLPIELIYDKNGNFYTMSGIVVIAFYVVFGAFYIFVIIALVLFRKKRSKQKILPVRVLLLFLTVGFMLSLLYPTLCVTEFLITIISYLMFHTIENPDLRLVNQLTLAKNEAEKASNAKSDFLSSMSHELRTPLNAIVGLSTMIKENSTDPESREDASDIYKASNSLLELVDGILDINKLESNDMEVTEKKYNPKELFDSAIRSANIRKGEKEIEIKANISEDLPNFLYGDCDKIKIIINNILSNAVKYTNNGFIKLSVDAFTVKDKCNLTISVADTGRGIPEDQISNLFTKFYRLAEDKDSNIQGTGLGLAITKSLVELLEGKISVNSTYGEGSTFIVTLSQMIPTDNDNNNSTDYEVL